MISLDSVGDSDFVLSAVGEGLGDAVGVGDRLLDRCCVSDAEYVSDRLSEKLVELVLVLLLRVTDSDCCCDSDSVSVCVCSDETVNDSDCVGELDNEMSSVTDSVVEGDSVWVGSELCVMVAVGSIEIDCENVPDSLSVEDNENVLEGVSGGVRVLGSVRVPESVNDSDRLGVEVIVTVAETE